MITESGASERLPRPRTIFGIVLESALVRFDLFRARACLANCTILSIALRIIPGATSFLVLPKNVSRSVAVGSILKHDSAPSLLASATAAAFGRTAISLSPASPVPAYSTFPPPSSPTLRPEEDDAIHRGTPRINSHAHLPAHLHPHRHHSHHYGAISTPTALPSTLAEHTNSNTLMAPGTPHAEANTEETGTSLPQNSISNSIFALWTKYDFILTISGDEPLIRRMNQLPQAGAVVETCSTSGKGSDAHWRLDPKEEGVVKVLEELVSAKVDAEEEGSGGLLKPTHLELDPEELESETIDVHA